MNTTHKRKYLQEVEVLQEEGDDKIVVFLNEFKSKCVMTHEQFNEMYEVVDEEGEYGWEVGFGEHAFITKQDIEVLYAALNSLEEDV